MLAIIIAILIAFFIPYYLVGRLSNETEFLMTEEYKQIFGGPAYMNNTKIRVCHRADLVFIKKI
jgi:hypothetical protein